MSIPAIAIVAAVPITLPCPLMAKNQFLQADIHAANELFIRVLKEANQSGQQLCQLQMNFPQQDTFAPEKARLFQDLRLLKKDMEIIHSLITLLLENPMPYLGTCIDFWTWADDRFQLLSLAEKNKG